MYFWGYFCRVFSPMDEDEVSLLSQFSKPRRASSRRRFASSSAATTMFHVGANAAANPPPDYELNFVASVAASFIGDALLGNELMPTEERVKEFARRALQPEKPKEEPPIKRPRKK